MRGVASAMMPRPLGLERLEALAPALLQDAHEVDDVVRLGDRVRDRVPVAQVDVERIDLPDPPRAAGRSARLGCRVGTSTR